jgi:hypothetical protein
VLAASFALAACGSDNHPKPTDAGAPELGKEPVVGGKLGAAIASAAAASSAAPVKAKAQQDGDQPPENGVFGPGEADKRQAKDAPPKIDVMSEGEGAKVLLAYKLDAPEVKTTISAGMRMGQQRVPQIDFAVSIKPADKAKDKADKGADKPKDKAKDKPAEAPLAAGAVRMVATITGATLPSTQGVAKEDLEALGKAKGTTISYDLNASGAATNFAIEMAKGAPAGFQGVVDAVADAMGLFTVVFPSKPVGLGAYWIAAERAKGEAGLDVVRYRVFKVLKMEGEVVTLSMDVRQYSAEQSLKDQGGELALQAFESKGTGALVWKADSFLAQKADVTEDTGARLTPPGQPPPQPGQRPGGLMLQIQLTAALGGGTGTPPKK